MKKLGTTLIAIAAAVGVAGPAMAAVNTNSASYWETYLEQTEGGDWTCYKSEADAGKMSAAAYGDLVLVKGGSVPGFAGAPGVRAWWDGGGAVMAPLNAGGQQAAISWIIVCDTDDEYPPS